MRNELLRRTLSSYRPSLLIRYTEGRRHLSDTTVAELLCLTMERPPSEIVTIFGCTDFVIKERMIEHRGRNFTAQGSLDFDRAEFVPQEWIEIEMLRG